MQGAANKWEAAGYLGMTEQLLDSRYGHHHPDYQQSVHGAFRPQRKESAKRSALRVVGGRDAK